MNRFILIAGLIAAGFAAASARAETPALGTSVSEVEALAGTRPAPGLPSRIEVAFVLDTTGSMGGLIDGAKRKIWAIADEIRKQNPNAEIRIGLVAYRDRGDVYVTDKTDLTSDISAVYGKLIQVQAAGGGDWPESVNEALAVAVNRLGWNKGPDTRRIVFLVGDAPPHMDYAQDVPFTDTLKIAEREGIVVNAVQAGNAKDTELIWRTIADLGHGRYLPIPQTGGVVVIETPYDQQILKLQIELQRTVIPYGSLKQQSMVREKVGVAAAAPAPAASDMASYSVRAAKPAERKVVTGEGDLVADVAAGRAKVEEIKTEDLPPELKALAPAARRAEIDKHLATRKALQGDLEKLVAQRDGFIAEARAKQPRGTDGFDRVVEAVIRDQIR